MKIILLLYAKCSAGITVDADSSGDVYFYLYAHSECALEYHAINILNLCLASVEYPNMIKGSRGISVRFDIDDLNSNWIETLIR